MKKIIDAIIPFYNIVFKEPNTTLELFGTVISTNPKYALEFFDRFENRLFYGEVDYETSIDCYTISCYGAIDEILNLRDAKTKWEVAHFMNGYVKNLICSFWFVKDHSIQSYPCLATFPGQDRPYNRNLNNKMFSNSKGEMDTVVEFTGDEFEKGIYFFLESNRFTAMIPETHPKSVTEGQTSHLGTINYVVYNKKVNRITRALFLIKNAMTNSLLPEKIKVYISVLECLFSTSRQELSLTISTRTSQYIEGDEDRKLEVYNVVRTAYGIRSSFVHGDALENKLAAIEKLRDCSQKMDQILREILIHVMKASSSEPFLNKSNKVINKWFEEKAPLPPSVTGG